jgi:hypothetical protein
MSGKKVQRPAKRIRRSNADRVGPLRNFANLYSGLASRAQSDRTFTSRTNHGKSGTSDAPGGGTGLAYRVIDKYIEQGRRMAEQFNRQSYGKILGGAPVQQLIDRMLRYQAEMLPLWLDLFGSLVQFDRVPLRDNGIHPGQPSADANWSEIALEVSSIQPIAVSIQLKPASGGRDLIISRLYASERRKPALKKIRFARSRNGVQGKLSITIPAEQPAGTYSGVFIDRSTGSACGSLSVRVAEVQPKAHRPSA